MAISVLPKATWRANGIHPIWRPLLRLGCLNDDTVSGALSKSWMANLLGRLRHARRANTRRGSRRNIAAHYDLGNDFYRLWLDETMTYSSAVFADMSEPIVPAQQRKYRRLAKKLDLQPDDRVLEIGCGWGGFAEIAAAEFGCRVVGLTLSREQAAHARTRMTRLGVADAVDIRLQDYRDVTSTFDKIVSIEMFEAVGERHWPAFFKALNDRLVLGGRAALQIITIDDDKFAGYRRNPDFIQRYIFPGGMLPSPEAFDAAAKRGGFDVRDAYFFGTSYAESLRRWDHAFRENWPEIAKVGFDERFRRMWHYYLRYCEVGFRPRDYRRRAIPPRAVMTPGAAERLNVRGFAGLCPACLCRRVADHPRLHPPAGPLRC